jgi:hypothetical protein
LLEKIALENSGISFLTFPKMETVYFPFLELSKKGNCNISESFENIGDVVRILKPRMRHTKTSTFHKVLVSFFFSLS